jgi:hypothetical protein
MDEKSPNEIIAELWENWDSTGHEANLLRVVGMLLTRIEELEEKVDGLQSESSLQESVRSAAS